MRALDTLYYTDEDSHVGTLAGGTYYIEATADFSAGGTISFQRLAADGLSYVNVVSAFTATGIARQSLPPGQYRTLVDFAADPTADVQTAADDAALAAANGTISGNAAARTAVATLIADIAALAAAVAAHNPATATLALAAAIAAEAAAEAVPAISGDPTALGLVQQVGTDLAAIDLSAPVSVFAEIKRIPGE